MNKILVVDGHSIINRAFYGVPDLTNKSGLHTNAIFGFINILLKAMDDEKPTHLAVAFDVHAPTFRHVMYKEYKGTRHPMPDELREQVPVMQDLLQAMNIPIMTQEGYEADDLLGTMAKKAQSEGWEAVILSGDRDLLQIADEHIKIRIPKTKGGKTEVEEYFPKDVKEKYGVTPLQFIDVKALMGDSSDNIPGVPKVGEKTAISLIQQFGSMDGIYEHIEEVSKPAIKTSLLENKETAYFCQKLVTIITDAPLPISPEDTAIQNFYNDKSFAMMKDLELKSFLSRFSVTSVENREEVKTEIFDSFENAKAGLLSMTKGDRKTGGDSAKFNEKRFFGVELCLDSTVDFFATGQNSEGQKTEEKKENPESTEIAEEKEDTENKEIAKNIETTGEQLSLFDMAGTVDSAEVYAENSAVVYVENSVEKKLPQRVLAAAVSDGEKTIAFPIKNTGEEEDFLDFLFGDGQIKLSVAGVKRFYALMKEEELQAPSKEISNRFFDGVIAAYLLNPLKNDYDAESLIEQYNNPDLTPYITIFSKEKPEDLMKSGDDEKKEKYLRYLGSIAGGLYHASLELEKKLQETGMDALFHDMEMPVSLTLYEMEREGIRILPEELKNYGDSLEGRIDELHDKIVEEAGEEFNINSPKQLGEILFEKKGIHGGKKTKTGYSTAADVLEKLAPEFPFVADILEYRGLTKLKSTYADGLAEQIRSDGRIHTTFQQTVTATGRLSSTDPNLQNIPIRMEMGRMIRKVFVPKDGSIFMDADYSQIELRLLAHLSEDPQLIEAYNSGEDIHAITASKVFHVPLEEVTPLLRRRAKAVNFGIVYGISSFGLSQDLNLSKKEAQQYIEDYFVTYPGIKGFLDGAVKNAKEKGYSETLYARRRPIPELKSSNFMQRSFGERVAMNAPIQGTAADIMKIAMIRVRDALREANLESRILIQVHDELLLEVKESEKEQVREILKGEMERAADLSVRLEVDLHTGENWYDAK